MFSGKYWCGISSIKLHHAALLGRINSTIRTLSKTLPVYFKEILFYFHYAPLPFLLSPLTPTSHLMWLCLPESGPVGGPCHCHQALPHKSNSVHCTFLFNVVESLPYDIKHIELIVAVKTKGKRNSTSHNSPLVCAHWQYEYLHLRVWWQKHL